MDGELKLKLFGNNQNNQNAQQTTNEEKQDINPFDAYNILYEEFNGSENDAIDEETFNKLLNGKIESDDQLALSIIEAAKLDEIEELSEEEFDYLIADLFDDNSDEIEDAVEQISALDDFALQQANSYTTRYLNKDATQCSEEELNYSYTLSLIEGMINSTSEGLANQQEENGAITGFFDWIKNATTWGTSSNDVEAEIKTQQETFNALLKTLQEGGDFEAKYKELLGVDFDIEKIEKYQEMTTQLQIASMNSQKTNNFYASLQTDEVKNNPEKTLELFVEFYGEEKGKEKFLEGIKAGYKSATDVSIDENNNVTIKYKGLSGKEKTQTYSFDELSKKQMKGMYKNEFLNTLQEDCISSFEKSMNVDYETLAQEYNQTQKEIFGNLNSLNETLNKYMQSQEGFTDTLGTIAQIGGMACMVVGAVACFIPLPGTRVAGGAMLKGGQIAAIAGTFGDNALDLIDTATNKKIGKEDLEEYKALLKETLVDGALFLTGVGAGTVGNAVGGRILSKTGSALLSKATDIGLDSILSLLGDLAITGEIDLSGESVSQLLGILTGSATAKIGKMKTDSKVYKPQELLDPTHEYGKMYEKNGEWYIYDKTDNTLVRNYEFEAKYKAYQAEVDKLVNSNAADTQKLDPTHEYGKIYKIDGEWYIYDKTDGKFVRDYELEAKLAELNSKTTTNNSSEGLKMKQDENITPHELYELDTNSILQLGDTTLDLTDPVIQKALMNLENNQRLTIGRGENNDITIAGEDSVSRQHATIYKFDNKFYIVDEGSTNGTKYLGESNYNNIQKIDYSAPTTKLVNAELEMYVNKKYLNTDLNLQDFKTSISNLYQNYTHSGNSVQDNFWQGYNNKNNIHSPWKMHIFADNNEDYKLIANAILPYLLNNGITHKTLGTGENATIENLNNSVQAGKAFTIYPTSIDDMGKIAMEIEYILKANNLGKQDTYIQGDGTLGDSGRIFYRYEYRSKEFQDIALDMSKGKLMKDQDPKIFNDALNALGRYLNNLPPNECRSLLTEWGYESINECLKSAANMRAYEFMNKFLYDANRGGNNYLAPDMIAENNPWEYC